jgi:hypothetical protein
MQVRERLGSTRVSRVGFGVAPKQASITFLCGRCFKVIRKVREREDALANTRDARSPDGH